MDIHQQLVNRTSHEDRDFEMVVIKFKTLELLVWSNILCTIDCRESPVGDKRPISLSSQLWFIAFQLFICAWKVDEIYQEEVSCGLHHLLKKAMSFNEEFGGGGECWTSFGK